MTARYEVPDHIRGETVGSTQLVFTWSSQCPHIQYVVTAVNCGICPNTTTNTTVTCTLVSESEPQNCPCFFAIQPEVCESISGIRSDFVTVTYGEKF